ncbi:hypothetical protein ACFLQ9_00200 [Bacteroidota bacterium]
MLWCGIYYPGIYKKYLQEETLTEKKTETNVWLDKLVAELERKDILSKIKEKSPGEIIKEGKKMQREQIEELTKHYERLIKIQNIIEKGTGEKSSLEKYSKKYEKRLNELKRGPLPKVDKYTNVEQLVELINYSQDNISFWKAKNIDSLKLEGLAIDEKRTYLLENSIFDLIVHIEWSKINTDSLIANTWQQKTLVDALLVDGKNLHPPEDWQYYDLWFAKHLPPINANICVMSLIDLRDYRKKVDAFYSRFGGFLTFFILFFPLFYVVAEHLSVKNSQKYKERHYLHEKRMPSLWQIIRGNSLTKVFFFMIPILSPLVILYIAAEGSQADVAIIVMFAFIFTAFTLPILLKVKKVRWLFKKGLEMECFYAGWNRNKNTNIYTYEYQGNVYRIEEQRLSDQKNFVPGETRLTVLVNPLKPNKAVLKENYTGKR